MFANMCVCFCTHVVRIRIQRVCCKTPRPHPLTHPLTHPHSHHSHTLTASSSHFHSLILSRSLPLRPDPECARDHHAPSLRGRRQGRAHRLHSGPRSVGQGAAACRSAHACRQRSTHATRPQTTLHAQRNKPCHEPNTHTTFSTSVIPFAAGANAAAGGLHHPLPLRVARAGRRQGRRRGHAG